MATRPQPRVAVMPAKSQTQAATRGAKAWNAWRKQNPGPTLSRPHWYDSPGRGGVQVKGRNRIDFSGANLSGISIHGAFAEGIHLRSAIFENIVFEEGDFSRADFSGAAFRSTRFNKTILTGANFDDATFV
ncbi:MAG TPA: pentapeptide repeat-containing protein, partial [Candidatus Angelobacter sp.]|nr:pentapeptide repeat-containing protein [Candidatus Angelobacter sp.]